VTDVRRLPDGVLRRGAQIFQHQNELIAAHSRRGIAFARRVQRDRAHQRAAHEAYQAQMVAYREKIAAEEAEIASGVRKEEMFLDDDGNLVTAPAHLSRWREEAS
jgi:hypothetical protein